MNKVQHFDFPVTDEEKAKKFCEDVFSWQVKEFPTSKGPYHMIITGAVDENGRNVEVNTINGGFYKRSGPEDSAVFWVTVESIEETIEKVIEHGGREVMPKMDMGDGMGWGAKIEDADGNVFGLWQETKQD